MTDLTDNILEMLDMGHKPSEIAAVLDCSTSHVWRVAREHKGPRRILGRNVLDMQAKSIAFRIEKKKHELLSLEMELLRVQEKRGQHASR